MQHNLLDQSPKSNGDAEPRWMVIHYPIEPKRHRWSAELAETLINYGWVIWREGADAHRKHRCLMPH